MSFDGETVCCGRSLGSIDVVATMRNVFDGIRKK